MRVYIERVRDRDRLDRGKNILEKYKESEE